MATQNPLIVIKRIIVIIVLSSFFIMSALIITGQYSLPQSNQFQTISSHTLWQYQCIDTMKTSRDKARAWAGRPDLERLITREMKAISDMGANCVAIDTPYDTEFLPYLKKWVGAARRENLAIWFRGNFSSWEGWFEYPKRMSSETLLAKTYSFITTNKSLFEDGDIFTAAPEAENGGPFNQVEKDEHVIYRKFLVEEQNTVKKAFAEIGKNVEVNWLSMNGGLAKRMFDQSTVDKLDKTVAIDHYIKTAPEMSEFIQYFANTFGAKTIIGEFGAPIPEINGEMSEDEQASFINKLFRELYKEKDNVIGINYWVLYDSSTELYNKDFTPRKSVGVIEQYFKPTHVKGKITNTLNESLSNISVKTKDGLNSIITNEKGEFELLLPATSSHMILVTEHPYYHSAQFQIPLTLGKTISKEITLSPKKEDIFYKLKKFIRRRFN